MVKKDVSQDLQDIKSKESVVETEDSNIEHINKLINNSDEESYVVSEDEKSYKTIDSDKEELIEEDTKEEKEQPKQKETKKIEKKPIEKVEDKHTNIKKSVTKPITKPFKKGLERTKMVKHKIVEHKKEVETKNKTDKKHKGTSSKMVWLWVGIVVVVLIIIAVVLFATRNINPVNNPTTNPVAATVNGEPIYQKDVNDQYDRLNPILQKTYTKEVILNQSIDELLLVQEAKKMNIQVSADTLQTELTNFKQQNQLTDQQLADVLKQQNLTMKDLQNLIEKRVMVRELLNQTILNNITVTDDEIQKYYDNNSASFKDPEKVTVQHILILTTGNVTDAQGKAKIDQINSMLTDSNFCELVVNYTQDDGSKGDCGKYTFGKGEMVPEFENASFSLGINQTKIVKSMYGYHLIKKLGYTPEKVVPLSEVRAQLTQTVHDVIAQQNFEDFVAVLRSKADIKNYLIKQDATLNNAQPATQTNTVNTNVEITNNAAATTTTTKNYDDFAKCLTSKGAKFYGASWCPHCQEQKAMFGDSLQYVKYVECAVPGNDQIQAPECEAAGITGYPTWIINGQSYAGAQQISDLARLTGCVAP